jgi:hypothetical protein
MATTRAPTTAESNRKIPLAVLPQGSADSSVIMFATASHDVRSFHWTARVWPVRVWSVCGVADNWVRRTPCLLLLAGRTGGRHEHSTGPH